MRLSILICTIPERDLILEDLLLTIPVHPEVEVLTECSARHDQGGPTTGAKRNTLLARATGDYIAYLDDDDVISKDYVPLVLGALATGPDCVGIRGHYFRENEYLGVFEHSIRHREWANMEGGLHGMVRYLRPPNHLNPVRRDLALATGFPDETFAEDKDYSLRLMEKLSTEVMVEKAIYKYNALMKLG
jgi:glycosyltransferase involved in cell wall biosynthesis